MKLVKKTRGASMDWRDVKIGDVFVVVDDPEEMVWIKLRQTGGAGDNSFSLTNSVLADCTKDLVVTHLAGAELYY